VAGAADPGAPDDVDGWPFDSSAVRPNRPNKPRSSKSDGLPLGLPLLGLLFPGGPVGRLHLVLDAVTVQVEYSRVAAEFAS